MKSIATAIALSTRDVDQNTPAALEKLVNDLLRHAKSSLMEQIREYQMSKTLNRFRKIK